MLAKTNKELLQNWREWEKEKKAFYDRNAEAIESGKFVQEDNFYSDTFESEKHRWSSLKTAVKKLEPVYDMNFTSWAKRRYELPQDELDKIKNAIIDANTRLLDLMKKRVNTIKRKRITSGAMPYSDDIHKCIDELMDLFDTHIEDCRMPNDFTHYLLYVDKYICDADYYGIDEKDFDYKFPSKFSSIFN